MRGDRCAPRRKASSRSLKRRARHDAVKVLGAFYRTLVGVDVDK